MARLEISTLIRFLAGSKQAIIDIATNRWALLLGALFVLSAGFAREYDGEDLLHEPWHLLLPMVASLVTSFVLFFILFATTQRHVDTPLQFLPCYRRFLTIYWMTAPLAWIYAIPVELFMSASNAVIINLWFLAVVAVWRVLLITRCSSVLFGSSFLASFFLVMLFADTLALVVLYFTPLPIFNIMGGIRLTESEAIIRDTACMIQTNGVLSWPIWFIASCFIFGSTKRKWTLLQFAEETSVSISKPLWVVSVLSLVVWVVVLPSFQPPQRLRRLVEEHLLNNRVEIAIQEMSAHDRQLFPPHWDPPPWPGYGQDTPPLLQVLQAMSQEPTADWVEEVFFEKLKHEMGQSSPSYYFWRSMEDHEFEAYVNILQEAPKMHDAVRKNSSLFIALLKDTSDENRFREPLIRSLLETVGVDMPDVDRPDQENPAIETEQTGEPTSEEDSREDE